MSKEEVKEVNESSQEYRIEEKNGENRNVSNITTIKISKPNKNESFDKDNDE